MEFETNINDSLIKKVDTLEIQILNNVFSFKRKNQVNYLLIDYNKSISYEILSNANQAKVIDNNEKINIDSTNVLYKIDKKCSVDSIKKEILNRLLYSKITINNKCSDLTIIYNNDSLETKNNIYLLNDGFLEIEGVNQNKIIEKLSFNYLNSIKINYNLIVEKFYCPEKKLFKLPRKKIIWDRNKGQYVKYKKATNKY
jgi:hypothetical protein